MQQESDCYGFNCVPKIDILESYFPVSQNMISFGDRIFTGAGIKLK